MTLGWWCKTVEGHFFLPWGYGLEGIFAIAVDVQQDNCTSYNSVNKFQQYAVGAVRRAANQNPTIAGGNRTMILSATSRPKTGGTEYDR